VELLLKDERKSVNPATTDNFCILIAGEQRHYDVVKLLLEDDRKIIDPSRENNVVMRHACEDGRLDVVKLLVENFGYLVDKDLGLKIAVKFKRTEIIVYLVWELKREWLILCTGMEILGDVIEGIQRLVMCLEIVT
jgi:hypothetical protein